MALDPKAEATLALHRFGLGPRAGAVAAMVSDPRGALIAELESPGAGQITQQHSLMSGGEAARAAFRFQAAQRMARQAQRAARSAGTAANGEQGNTARPRADANPGPPVPQSVPPPLNASPTAGPAPQQIYLEEAKVRLATALGAQIGFAERLVWFWSNHFCVSADKGPVRSICGAYEREAIRPHVLGRFADMLAAVETHPAMLFYLDNARSIGPNSLAGKNRGLGLNENLAREILELHTLGVRTVYDQTDVTSFAKIITGWSIIPMRQDPVHGGEFTFNPNMHEPGPQMLIGRSYAEQGFEQGRQALAALARHPATARHVAVKLARHFVADDPPLALTERLTKRFLETDGDLREMAKSLVAAPEAWASPRQKLKHPGEWIVAALRATGASPADVRPLIQAQNVLGEPLWRPPAPNGFADDAGTWLDGLAQRLDVANQFARLFGAGVDPMAVFEETLAPIASADTRQTIARAESRPQALALLLMAPEFQRR